MAAEYATEPFIDKKPTRVSVATRSYPMDSLNSWIVCMCSSLAGLISNGIGYTYGLFFPSLLTEFKAGKAKTAIAGALVFGICTLVSPVSAKLCKRFGSRVVMVCGGIICVLGIVGSAFSPSLYLLYFTYGIVVGFGCSMVYIASFEMVSLYFEKHQSVATAMVSGSAASGLIVMSPIVAVLLDHFDWRKSFMVLAGINVLPSILACCITRKRSDYQQPAKEQQQPTRKKFDVPLYKDPVFVLVTCTFITAGLGQLIPTVHLAKYCEDLGIPGHLSSWMYFAIGSTSLVSRIVTGKVCDTGWISNMRIFQLGAVTFAIADFLVPLAKSFTALMIYSVTFGLCEGMFTTPLYCFVMKLYSAEGLGWHISFHVIPQFFGPVLAGLIADGTGSYHPAFFTAGVFLVFAACMSLLMPFFQTSDKITATECDHEEFVIFEKETVC